MESVARLHEMLGTKPCSELSLRLTALLEPCGETACADILKRLEGLQTKFVDSYTRERTATTADIAKDHYALGVKVGRLPVHRWLSCA